MIRIILSGIHGKMGREVVAVCKQQPQFEVKAGFARENGFSGEIPVFENYHSFTAKADILMDFSHPGMTDSLLAYCRNTKMPLVIGTTGHSETQRDGIIALGQYVPVFYSSNFSLGISLVASFARHAAQILGESYDVDIVDKHHREKIDAPSGTAFLIANTINDGSNIKYSIGTDATEMSCPRKPGHISIHSLRYGAIPGEHDVVFASGDEVITLSHSALSRSVFARGALKAAEFIKNMPPGIYDTMDLIK